MDVPRETMASEARRGRASIVAGLSPVKATICVDEGKPYRLLKYGEMVPKLAPPSSGTCPSFALRSSTPALLPAASASSSSCHRPFLISHRFAPHTSLISIGATFPRKTDARNEDTSDIREVALYASGYFSWNR